ncbi:two-component system sensor histidine kinase CreC [Luteimonas sp. MHLX1A]|uniref:two-component system sensor histidine kinase CreC n=1 Tax=Alterluteimonas muca TaxID=2878684 RepID=UPI001E49FF62|nr:two-component system sensor histidine kinase CreC [Luteimonas sp. MHLX1A]MCD9046050.1 two-component system sensor histidine kinase CreC [Luteimonas sp. MHLX1A]
MRIGLRLFLAFFLIVGVAAFFVMRVFVDEVKPGVRQALEATLVDSANTLAELAADDLKAGRIADGRFAQRVAQAHARDPGARVWEFAKTSVDQEIVITDAQGVVVYASTGRDIGRDNSRWNDVYRTLRGEYGARSTPRVPGADDDSVMHVAAPVRDPDDPSRLLGVLTLSQPNRSVEPFIVASQRSILARGAWLIGIAALIGIAMTWWLVRGIGGLNRYAQAVARGEPVPPPRPRRDEIGDLGQALEAMRRRLEGKAYVEQYVQSLTHEMKSPLAAIGASAELLQEPLPDAERARFAANILAQQQRLTETIDKLLALAEVEQHGWLQKREPIDVAALLQQAAEAVVADGRDVRVRCDAAAGVQVSGDPFLLRQALRNLVDNALAFSPAGGEVRVDAVVDAGRVRIRVADRGPGVPDYARERVFERFYSLPRPDGTPRSSGLGLPFVREVARLHGGDVRLENRDGGGAIAMLSLPLA